MVGLARTDVNGSGLPAAGSGPPLTQDQELVNSFNRYLNIL